MTEIRRYCHIGSGNYNSDTARIYEDVGLFTADPDIGADVGELFNLLTGSGDAPTFRRLVVSPVSTRAHLRRRHRRGGRGRAGRAASSSRPTASPIRAIIDALYRASQAGVSVDLIVRGRCCLRPGVPGLSERIRVRSIVGRYLEHSRIFRFGGVDGRPLRMYIGSPDLMERNLDRRVEVIVPIDDPDIQRRLVGILDDALRDEANSWTLGPTAAGSGWTRAAGRRRSGSTCRITSKRRPSNPCRPSARCAPECTSATGGGTGAGAASRRPATASAPSRRWLAATVAAADGR